MPKQSDPRNISASNLWEVHGCNDLELFRRRLEREYFANVGIRKFACDDFRSDLVVELQINLTLVEFIYNVQQQNVGLLTRLENNYFKEDAFCGALNNLRTACNCELDVEELTLLLSDSEITIKKIYQNSIEDQLGNIYEALDKHFIHISNDQSTIPSEIYIPVFEENPEEKFKIGASKERTASSKKDYFNFWGIYFSHNDDAVIYDLEQRSIISGDLYILD